MKAFGIAILLFVSVGVAASTLDVTRATEIQLSSIAETLESFRTDCDRLPSESEFLALARTDGSGCKSAHYLRGAQLSDHWGNNIVYEVKAGDFNLLSIGADRLRGSADDIVYGVKERPWQSSYRDAIDHRDDFVDRWRNTIFVVMGLAAAVAIAGLIQLRRARRKS